MAGIITFGATACGEENANTADNSSADTNTSSQSSTESSDVGEITLEDVLNHEVSPESDFEFSEDGAGNSGVLSYSGSDNIVVIPETHEGLSVTKIETGAFSNKEGEKAIKFAEVSFDIL